MQDVNTQQPYHVGDKVQVVFQSACPRNNLRTEDTFLTVERLDTATGNWSVVRMWQCCSHSRPVWAVRYLWQHVACSPMVNVFTLHQDCVPSALSLVAALLFTWRLLCVFEQPAP